jgi:hypothetical protein
MEIYTSNRIVIPPEVEGPAVLPVLTQHVKPNSMRAVNGPTKSRALIQSMSFSEACLAARVRSPWDNSAALYEKAVPRRLKPVRFARLYGTAEPVPFRSLVPFAF